MYNPVDKKVAHAHVRTKLWNLGRICSLMTSHCVDFGSNVSICSPQKSTTTPVTSSSSKFGLNSTAGYEPKIGSRADLPLALQLLRRESSPPPPPPPSLMETIFLLCFKLSRGISDLKFLRFDNFRRRKESSSYFDRTAVSFASTVFGT